MPEIIYAALINREQREARKCGVKSGVVRHCSKPCLDKGARHNAVLEEAPLFANFPRFD